jgi:hypothetical protein
MAQLYDKAKLSIEDDVIDELGAWIDQYNLASMIVGAIEDEYGSATLEQGKDFWYRALEYHLPELFQHIAQTLPDPADAKYA